MPLARLLLPSTVLVVEDDEVLRMCTSEVVADAGFTPIEAANADEAVAILESRSDIVLFSQTSRCPAAWMVWGLRGQSMTDGRPSRSFWCGDELSCPNMKDPSTAASSRSLLR